MAKIYYPAVFHKEDNDTYWVEFPDLPGCLTQGKSFKNMGGNSRLLVSEMKALFVA